MTPGRRRWARTAAALALAVVLPLLVEAELVAWMRAHGAATVMLGAAAGSTHAAIAAMAVALLLRVYTVVALPGVLVAWLVTTLAARLMRPPPVSEAP
jgi:hypothetical protein